MSRFAHDIEQAGGQDVEPDIAGNSQELRQYRGAEEQERGSHPREVEERFPARPDAEKECSEEQCNYRTCKGQQMNSRRR